MKVPITGKEWTFDPDRSDGGVRVNRIGVDMPEYQVGASIRLRMSFYPDNGVTFNADTGGTAGTETGFTAGGAVGATLGATQATDDHLDRYEKVREYTRYAGRYTERTAFDGTVRVADRTPSSAPIPSIIVQLTPGDELDRTDGLWIVLDSVDDPSRFIESAAELDIQAMILARGDQYADRTALLNDIGAGI